MSPWPMANDTSESAVSPPKRLVMASTSRSRGTPAAGWASGIPRHRELALAHRRGQQPCRPEKHHDHHRQAEEQHAEHFGIDVRPAEELQLERRHRVAQHLRHEGEQHRPEDHAQMLPMPPSTTMASTITLSVRMKLSGLMKPWIAENMPPATPPNEAPIAKASSFMLRVLMPMERAASSSSRIASQARPMREFCRRRFTMITRTST